MIPSVTSSGGDPSERIKRYQSMREHKQSLSTYRDWIEKDTRLIKKHEEGGADWTFEESVEP